MHILSGSLCYGETGWRWQSGGLSDADSDLPEAWDVNQGGSSNIVIGIIDDGIESSHPDLNVWTNAGETDFDGIDNDGNGWVDDVRGWNFVADTNQTEPAGTDKHGTAVAGVATARKRAISDLDRKLSNRRSKRK